jgi:hypothetical protein
VEDASRVAGDDRSGHALEGNIPLQRQEPLGLLTGDGLLAQPDVVECEPVVLGLEARVVVAELIDLSDRGRKAVTGGADPCEPRTTSVFRSPSSSRLTTTSSAKGRRTPP